MKKYILLLIILFFSQAAFCVSHSDSPVIYENSKPIKSGTIKVYKMDMELTQKPIFQKLKFQTAKFFLKLLMEQSRRFVMKQLYLMPRM